ncbi:MAG TPA: hypothetical protein PKD51_18700 [Saprospiraceae bacterium]|nr:hypothetical protein [Saprospiraceae bacterium]
MKFLVFVFLAFFNLNHINAQGTNDCSNILGYGVFDSKTIMSEHELVERLISVTQRSSKFDASNEIGFAIPEILLPASSKLKFSNRKDYFSNILSNTSKRDQYFSEVITASKPIISAWQNCMVDKRCSFSARVIDDTSNNFKDVTLELYYSFFNAPDSVKFQLIPDTTSFEIKQGFNNTFSVYNNAPCIIKIKRKTDNSFNLIFKTKDKGDYSVYVMLPEIVKIPIDINNYLTVYEGVTHHCNGHHLSTSSKFRLPGQPRNCGRSSPYGRITSNHDTTKGNREAVYDVNGRLTNSPKGRLVGYISSKPIDGGKAVVFQGENIITKSFPNAVIFGYLYPL